MSLPKVCGVYVIEGPLGVYVGESVRCHHRNEQLTKLGIPWRIVRELPAGATLRERRAAEREVADELEAQGCVVVSRNTSAAYTAHAVRRNQRILEMGGWPKGHRLTSEHKRKLSEANRGHPVSPEARRLQREGMRRYWTPEQRARKSEAMRQHWAQRRSAA